MPSILVTGANRGFGLEIVRHYVGQKWIVHACYRNADSAKELRNLSDKSEKLIALHELEVRDRKSIEDLKEKLSGDVIDVLINNAGISIGRDDEFGELNYSSWEEVLDVNMLGPAKISESLVENIAQSDKRIIVFISSDLASICNHDGRSLYY